MSGLMHPVGPQPPAVYWLRRALVLGVLVALVALLVAVLTPAPKQQAVPAAAPSSVLATSATVAPSGSGTATGTMTAAAPTTAKSSAAKSSASPKASKSIEASKKSPKATKKSPKAQPNQLPRCALSQLRVTLKAPGRLQAGKPATFELSLVNGSATSCLARVSGDDLELQIYSGRDRIWSSADCSTAIKPVKQKLAAERAVEWQQKWNGRRSAPKCASRPELPRPGTYISTARLGEAPAVQARTILHG